jgi:hypothetical protein
MTQVLTSAREADRLGERNRVAWNLPRGRLAAPSQKTLGWYAFLARYFPGRGRHELEALTAYGAYRSSGGTVRPEAEALAQPQPDSPAATPEDAWEDDGGATLANGRVPAATS